MADTHDRLSVVRTALSILEGRNIRTVLHAGDFISPFVIPLFKGIRLYGVYGNNDGDRSGLCSKFSEIGGTVMDYFCPLTLDSCTIAVTHGHIPELLTLLMNSGLYDLVVTGHTHEPEIREGAPILINPGECCGYLSNRNTIAIFDTRKKKGEILEIC
ncbi:MAG: metallophosphoesterase [Theionarchaea archaeon]|nr:metallophosphoesterase [Theionarchaea archaeon]